MVTVAGAGTPEAAWLPFLAGLPLFPLPAGPVTLVAPHPDDEVLAAGGLLALLVAAGVPVEVVSVTDGEASNPGGSVPPAELAARRVAETAAALAALGVTARRRLGLPDGGAADLEAPVAALEPGQVLVGPWAGDGHPDHEAVGRGCAAAAARTGATLVRYPVWAWHWAGPGDARVPWDDAARLELPPAVRAAKLRALAEFGSQTRALGPRPEDLPVLPPAVLARFTRPFETFFG